MPDKYTATSVLHRFAEGEALFHEGERSRYIYYVDQGALQVFTEADGQRVILGEVKPGEYVGELGVLQETPRNASVIALAESHVKQLNKWAFIELIIQDPEKSIRFLHSLSYRTSNAAQLSKQIAQEIAKHDTSLSFNPIRVLFSSANSVSGYIKKLIYRRESLQYKRTSSAKLENGIHEIKKGKTLFYEGQESNYACRVVRGKFKGVKSLHDSYKNISVVGAGEYIGEIGLLEDTPRSLTVIAVEDSTIEVFDEDRFLKAVCTDADNCFELIKNLSRRAIDLNRHLKEITVKHAVIINPSILAQAKQLVQNIGDVSLLTGRMLERDVYKIQWALRQEVSAVQGMLETYYKYMAGRASSQEMERANAEFRNFLKTLGLGAMIVIPGSFITIPLVVKIAKSLGVDILPKSRFE